MKSFRSILFLLFIVCIAPIAMAEDWTEDIDKAIKVAAKDGKDLLVLYTGSDWCPPCIKLEEEILSQKSFVDLVKPNFVLVKLDFPRKSEQAEEIKKRNQEWLKKYGVEGYPTIVLLDSDQRPFGFTGYESDGPDQYATMLEGLRQGRVRRDELFEQAADKKGLERARLLDQGLSEVRLEVAELYYKEIVEEIIELDSKNEAGLRSKWNEAKEAEERKIVLTDIITVARLGTSDEALELIEMSTEKINFPAEQMIQILQIKLNLLQKLREFDKVNETLDEMINLDGVEGTIRERLIVKKVLTMSGNGQRDKAMKMLNDAIDAGGDNLFMWLAKGELLDSEDKFEQAVQAYDRAIPKAGYNPDLLADLVGAKADALVELNEAQDALQMLDGFADNQQIPRDLRAEILIHKAMILRDQGRRRLAILDENRAVKLVEEIQLHAEMQKVVDQLRKRYGE